MTDHVPYISRNPSFPHCFNSISTVIDPCPSSYEVGQNLIGIAPSSLTDIFVLNKEIQRFHNLSMKN